jgi:hypothetical protein
LKSRFTIGGFGLPAQRFNGSDAFGHRPGQPEREVGRLLLTFRRALDAADHGLIVGDRRNVWYLGWWPNARR